MLETGLIFALLSVAAPPPPPIFDGQPASSAQLLSWNPGEIRCDGTLVQGAAIQRPAVEMGAVDPQRVRAANYRFAIDGAGRTRSIVRAEGEYSPFGQDIGPALAASRFPAGERRKNCEISYAPKFDPLASAPIADLVAYSMFPTGRRLPQAGWDRFGAAGNCRDKPRPAPLLSGHPDFLKLASTPGSRDWSLVAYDTDAEGRPIDVRIAEGTGNAELDAAAVAAIQMSRFTGGARTGCLYPYWRAAGTLAAPEAPAEEQMRPSNAICPTKVEWATPPITRYPPAYRKRAIEGWAIVSFDTAPWGEVGNVKVLEAQPSADFGEQAVSIVRSGRVAPSPQGASGCVKTVKFLMPIPNMAAEEDEPSTTY
jgi:TonB family protein